MREIKFRGKTKDGEWVKGSYVYAHKWFGGGKAGHFITSIYGDKRVFVDPETVGQFTGLEDKNGVEIYEGDIVYYSLFNVDGSDTRRKGIVKWSDTEKQMTGYLVWHDDDNEYYEADGAPELGWVCAQDDEIEVIGNIYDNPELLEV